MSNSRCYRGSGSGFFIAAFSSNYYDVSPRFGSSFGAFWVRITQLSSSSSSSRPITSMFHARVGLFSSLVSWPTQDTRYLLLLSRSPPSWPSASQFFFWFPILCFCQSLFLKSSLSGSRYNFLVSVVFPQSLFSCPLAFSSVIPVHLQVFFQVSNSLSAPCTLARMVWVSL